MKIEIRLKALLAELHKDERGILKELAGDINVDRHTIEHLYHNRVQNPSFDLLGKICDWLHEHGMPAERLPQALFGRGPQRLWEACASQGVVTLYLGENRQQQPGPKRPLWISKRDTALAFQLIGMLSDPAMTGRTGTEIVTNYLPYHVRLDDQETYVKEAFRTDVNQARLSYRELNRPRRASVLIGSVKTNYVVECMVAALFGCTPFAGAPIGGKRAGPPIYMQYRNVDRRTPSCMAGDGPPQGFTGKAKPGIYFLGDNGRWQRAPELDTGVVIVAYEPGAQNFQLAAFGFRGRTTQALGKQLRNRPDQFWSEDDLVKGKRVNISLCGFTFRKDGHFEDDGELVWTHRLAPQILGTRLAH